VVGHFVGGAPGCEQYDFGPSRRGFESYDGPRFPRHGGWQPQALRDLGYRVIDISNPSIEQMARHWFASFQTNPNVGPFAHPMYYH